jgi:hypothetical protein
VRNKIGIFGNQKFDLGVRYKFIAEIKQNTASFYIQKIKEDLHIEMEYKKSIEEIKFLLKK